MMMIEKRGSFGDLKSIDVNKVFPKRYLISVGELSPKELVENKNQGKPLTLGFKNELERTWAELKESKKPVRWLLENKKIESVEWGLLDQYLLESLENLGEIPAVRLVGEVLGRISENFLQVSDSVVWYRLRALIDEKDEKKVVLKNEGGLKNDSLVFLA